MPLKPSVLRIIVPLLLMPCSVFAGSNIPESKVPPTVIAVFKATYPTATDSEYELEDEKGETVYEIDFKVDGVKRELKVSPGGKILKDELDD